VLQAFFLAFGPFLIKIQATAIDMKHLLMLILPLMPLCTLAEPAPARASYDEAVKLSPLALQLAQCGEDAEGIRARLVLIQRHIAQEAEAYHVDGLTVPNLELIPIAVQEGDGRHLGGAQWAANNTILKVRMQFFTAALPPANDADSKLEREMTLNDTLAHELAHCFFYSRYPKLAKITQGLPLIICEGHAIHVARTFIQRHYFGGAPMPTAFYEKAFLSPHYTRLYREFSARYIGPDGRILRHAIDAAELYYAPKGYTLRNRTQISGY